MVNAGVECFETRAVLDELAGVRALRVRVEAYEMQLLAQLAADPDPYRDGSGSWASSGLSKTSRAR